jgi:hypothetical protein
VLRINVFSHRSVEIDLSQLHVVTGIIPNMCIAVRMFGKESASVLERSWSNDDGRGGSWLENFSLYMRNLHSRKSISGRSSSYSLRNVRNSLPSRDQKQTNSAFRTSYLKYPNFLRRTETVLDQEVDPRKG